MSKYLNAFLNFIMKIKPVKHTLKWMILQVGKVKWTLKNQLSQQEIDSVSAMCKDDYYILLSRNNNHLSTYFIGVSDFVLKGKVGYWGHAFMNTEDVVINDHDFRFVEAIGAGVVQATLEEATAVNSIALLKPKHMELADWTAVLDNTKTQIGKKYDALFDLKDDQRLSCVELVRLALMALPDYQTKFANFEAMVQKHQRITPQMFYDCPDFEVVYEVRRK